MFSINYRLVILGLSLGLSLLTSCSSSDDVSGEPVVMVENNTLTKGMLFHAIPDGLMPEDSIVFAQEFINRWVRSELLLRKAELNLNAKEKDVEVLLDEYRRSLLTHKYQQKLLDQKYSPLITDGDIRKYYSDMRDNFKLPNPIAKGLLVIVAKTAPNVDEVDRLYRSRRAEDMVELESYCFQNAAKYDNFVDDWRSVDVIWSKLPVAERQDASYLQHNTFYKTNDELYYYYLSVNEFIGTNEFAPVEYVKNSIKAILLNKKRLEFLKQLDADLYDEALTEKIITFY